MKLASLTLSGLLALSHPVLAQTTQTQYARVNQNQAGTSPVVTGQTASSVTALGSEVYWFNRDSNTYSSALGSTETVLGLGNVAQLRAYGANSAATGPYESVLGKMTLRPATFNSMSWSVDLGAGLLNSDQAGYQVTGSMIRVVDFGQAGDQTTVSFDFQVGLWDGSQVMLASSLDQLKLSVQPGSGNTALNHGAVSHVSGNTFRFTEDGLSTGSGTSLVISSALDGYFVRSFAASAFARDTTVNFSDQVDLNAARVLSVVPEPGAGLMLALGLVVLVVFRPSLGGAKAHRRLGAGRGRR